MTTGKIRCEDFIRKIRIALTVIVMLSVMPTGNSVYAACDSAGCVTMGSDLSMELFVEYQTKQYEFKLDYVPNASGLYWKMDESTFKQVQSYKLPARFIGAMPVDLADELNQEFSEASTDSDAPLIISGVDISTLSEAERSTIRTTFDNDIPIILVHPTYSQREALRSLVGLPGTDRADVICDFWGVQTTKKYEIHEYAFTSPTVRQVTNTVVYQWKEDGTIQTTEGPPISDYIAELPDYQQSRVAELKVWLAQASERANSQTAVATDSSMLTVESAGDDPKAKLEDVVLADYANAPFSYLNNKYTVNLASRSVYQTGSNYFVICAKGILDAFSEFKATTTTEERAFMNLMTPTDHTLGNTGRIATKYDISFYLPKDSTHEGELSEVAEIGPPSDNKSEEITYTVNWSLGGKVTGGTECDLTQKPKGYEAGCTGKVGVELSAGVTTSQSRKFTKKDVEIANISVPGNPSWSFKILPPMKFVNTAFGLSYWYRPAILATSTFQPDMTWVWKVSDTYRQRYKDGLPVVVEFTPTLFHAYQRYSFPWWQAFETYLFPEKPFICQVTLLWPPTTATVEK